MTPGEKRKRTLTKKLGGKKAYIEYMRQIASRGGKNGDPSLKPFAQDPELARRAGSRSRINRERKNEPN